MREILNEIYYPIIHRLRIGIAARTKLDFFYIDFRRKLRVKSDLERDIENSQGAVAQSGSEVVTGLAVGNAPACTGLYMIVAVPGVAELVGMALA